MKFSKYLTRILINKLSCYSDHFSPIRRNISISKMTANGSTEPKKKCVKIGTHDGKFHCDEVLACYLLKNLPEYKNATIVRSRNPELLKDCDVVVDVGGVFDPESHRYDHHQRSFNQSMNSLNESYPWMIKLSSAGLVYYHFGKRIIAEILELKEADSEKLQVLFNKMYEHFIQEIDAIDNGVNVCDEKPRYHVSSNISSRVGHLNPWWNDPNQDSDKGFYKAMTLVGEEFKDRVNYYSQAWWPAREIVHKAVQDRFQVHSSGEIIEFGMGGCPWKEHLFTLEEQLNVKPNIKFVLFTDQNGMWRVQAVNVSLDSFDCRLPLLEKWRGIRDQELSELSGIDDCIFVHTSGFIGGNKTRDGVLKMAEMTLNAKDV